MLAEKCSDREQRVQDECQTTALDMLKVRAKPVAFTCKSRARVDGVLSMNCPDLGTRRAVILHSPGPPKPTPDSTPAGFVQVVEQATSDDHLVELWLHGRSKHTKRSYGKDAEQFLDHVDK